MAVNPVILAMIEAVKQRKILFFCPDRTRVLECMDLVRVGVKSSKVGIYQPLSNKFCCGKGWVRFVTLTAIRQDTLAGLEIDDFVFDGVKPSAEELIWLQSRVR